MKKTEKLFRDCYEASLASIKATLARAMLPSGSLRAQVAGADAKWAAAVELRDLTRDRLWDRLADDHGHACPVCGSYKLLPASRELGSGKIVWWIECSSCGAEGGDCQSLSDALNAI